MTFEDEIIRTTVAKLLSGCDYRDEVINAINASFFDFSLKFFREIVEAKLSVFSLSSISKAVKPICR